jgi:hypothetical protein
LRGYVPWLAPGRLADFDRDVAGIAAQPFLLRARVGGRARRHVPGFMLVHADESVQVVKVKPASRLAAPRTREALAWPGRLFQARGWGHEVWSGADPVLLANLRFLAGAVRRPVGRQALLAAQQHIDALISTLLAAWGQPAETAALQQQLDDIHAVARAAASALTGTADPPAAATAVLAELGTEPGSDAAASTAGGPRRQLAPVTAFGVTVADIMLHGRGDDPDPVIAGWLAGNTASRRNTSSPADVLIHWDRASPPCRPPWPGRWRPGWMPSISSATAPSPARPASPTPPAPGSALRPCRR